MKKKVNENELMEEWHTAASSNLCMIANHEAELTEPELQKWLKWWVNDSLAMNPNFTVNRDGAKAQLRELFYCWTQAAVQLPHYKTTIDVIWNVLGKPK